MPEFRVSEISGTQDGSGPGTGSRADALGRHDNEAMVHRIRLDPLLQSRAHSLRRSRREALSALTAPMRRAALQDLADLGHRLRGWPSMAGKVSPAMCGVATTLGWRARCGRASDRRRGRRLEGGASSTLLIEGCGSAVSSSRFPRERLTRKASARISCNCGAPIRFRSPGCTASGSTKSSAGQLGELDLLGIPCSSMTKGSATSTVMPK